MPLIGGAVAAIVLGLILTAALGGFGGGGSIAGAAQPLAVRVSLAPSAVFFGDPVVATVAVDLDRRSVSPGSIRVEASFAPYTQAALPAVHRSRAGDEQTIVYRYELKCLSDECLPTKGSKLVSFPAVAVAAQAGGKALHASATWPLLTVASRLAPADVATPTPHFRIPSIPPPARFGVPPVLADLLAAAAGVLALGALALLALELRPLAARRRRAALARRTPLEAAIAYARQAAVRPNPADRRKALGLLARALAGAGAGELAGAAGDAAWSEAPPTPDRTLELAETADPNGRVS
jgi:hypothetical protein